MNLLDMLIKNNHNIKILQYNDTLRMCSAISQPSFPSNPSDISNVPNLSKLMVVTSTQEEW